MSAHVEIPLVALVLSGLALLGARQLTQCIRLVALQGVALGVLTVSGHDGPLTVRVALLAVGSIVLKSVVFPVLLSRAAREAGVRKELRPSIGHGLSVVLGAASLVACLWMSGKIVVPGTAPVAVAVSFFLLCTGFLLIVGRRVALQQVVGYLLLENGVYTFGIVAVGGIPLLVELGVLLDVFVAVFVMGIAIYQIRRAFDHVDVARLSKLRG